MSLRQHQDPFRASLWIRSGFRLALKDVGANLQTYQVGARFEGLTEGVLIAPLDSRYTQVGFNLSSVQVCKCVTIKHVDDNRVLKQRRAVNGPHWFTCSRCSITAPCTSEFTRVPVSQSGKDVHQSHRLFEKILAKVFLSANQGPILLQESISFHLSHQPPLKVMCYFLCSKCATFTTQIVT